ncbi:MAG: hypothetical protein JW864_02555 [Spirochaetes bacterium]|nr:hypothetical protein [Spirochaetota bacterium]
MTPALLTLLKSVPWDIVIRNAPRVAAEAKKLWDTIAKKEIQEIPSGRQSGTEAVKKMTPSEMQSKIIFLEKAVSDLNNQMLASSEIIKELAEQNTQLVRRIETSRVRLKLIALISTAVWIILVISLIITRTG